MRPIDFVFVVAHARLLGIPRIYLGKNAYSKAKPAV